MADTDLVRRAEVVKQFEDVAAGVVLLPGDTFLIDSFAFNLLRLPLSVAFEPSLFALQRRAHDIFAAVVMPALPPDFGTLDAHLVNAPGWIGLAKVVQALMIQRMDVSAFPSANVFMARLFTDDTIWPAGVFTSLEKLNQRKCWAQALRVWDFSLEHPMLRVNSHAALRTILRGELAPLPDESRDPPLSMTFDALTACLSNNVTRKKTMYNPEMDALISILAQAHHWETDPTKVLFTNSERALQFYAWLGWNALLGAWSDVKQSPPVDGFPYLEAFFTNSAYKQSTLVMPVFNPAPPPKPGERRGPGHLTFCAFFWQVDILQCALFDSVWRADGTSTSRTYVEFFVPLVQRLQTRWRVVVNPDLITFGPTMTQAGEECGALALYGMDMLCRDADRTGLAYANGRVIHYSKLFDTQATSRGLAVAGAIWAGSLQWYAQLAFLSGLAVSETTTPSLPLLAQWQSQLVFLYGLAVSETTNPSLPLLAQWTASIDQCGPLLLASVHSSIPVLLSDIGLTSHALALWQASVASAVTRWRPADKTAAVLFLLTILSDVAWDFVQAWFQHCLDPAQTPQFWFTLSQYTTTILEPYIIATPDARNKLHDFLQKIKDAPNFHAALATAYTAFQEARAPKDWLRFESENVLGALWPLDMVSVTSDMTTAARTLDTQRNTWQPVGLAASDTPILAGVLSSYIVTRPDDVFTPRYVSTMTGYRLFVADYASLFPEGTLQRAALLLRLTNAETEQAAAKQELATILTTWAGRDTKAVREGLTQWTRTVSAIDTMAEDALGDYDMDVLDPRVRIMFLSRPPATLRLTLPMRTHFLAEWVRDTQKLFDPDPKSLLSLAHVQQHYVDVNGILVQDATALSALIDLAGQPQSDLNAIEAETKKLYFNYALHKNEARSLSDTDVPAVLASVAQWDTLDDVRDFLHTVNGARLTSLLDGIDAQFEAVNKTVHATRQAIAKAANLDDLPSALRDFLFAKPTPTALSTLLRHLDYDTYQNSAIGSIDKRDKQPAVNKARFKQHFILLENAEVSFNAAQDVLEKNMIDRAAPILALDADDRAKRCAAAAKDYRGYIKSEALPPLLETWFADADDVDDNVTQTHILRVAELPYNLPPAILQAWMTEIDTRGQAFIASVEASPERADAVYTWFNGRLDALADTRAHAIAARASALHNTVAIVVYALYSNRLEVDSVSAALVNLVQNYSKDAGLTFAEAMAQPNWSVPPTSDFATRLAGVPIAFTFVQTHFKVRNGGAPARVGWQKYYFLKDAPLENSFQALFFDEAKLAVAFATLLTGVVQYATPDEFAAVVVQLKAFPGAKTLFKQVITTTPDFRAYLIKAMDDGREALTQETTAEVDRYRAQLNAIQIELDAAIPLEPIPLLPLVSYRPLDAAKELLIRDAMARVNQHTRTLQLHHTSVAIYRAIRWQHILLSVVFPRPVNDFDDAALWQHFYAFATELERKSLGVREVLREFCVHCGIVLDALPPPADYVSQGDLFILESVDGTPLITYPLLPLFPTVRLDAVDIQHAHYRNAVYTPLHQLGHHVLPPNLLPGAQVVHAALNKWRVEMGDMVEDFPFLLAPTDAAAVRDTWEQLSHWTNEHNLQRALLARDIIGGTAHPPFVAQTVTDFVTGNEAAFGGANTAYLSDADRDAIMANLGNAVDASVAELAAYRANFDTAKVRLTRIETHYHSTIPFLNQTQTVLLRRIANPPDLLPRPTTASLNDARVAAALTPAWQARVANDITAPLAQLEREYADYLVQHRINVAGAHGVVRPLDMAELENNTREIVAYKDKVDAHLHHASGKLGVLAPDTCDAYDALVTTVEADVTRVVTFLANEYGNNQTFRLDDDDDAVWAAVLGHFNTLYTTGLHMSNAVGRYRSDVNRLLSQLHVGMTVPPRPPVLTPERAAARLRIPAYDDAGDATRPPWLLSNLDVPGAERSRALFGGYYPTPQDQVLALTKYNAVDAENARERQVLHNEFVQHAYQERAYQRRVRQEALKTEDALDGRYH